MEDGANNGVSCTRVETTCNGCRIPMNVTTERISFKPYKDELYGTKDYCRLTQYYLLKYNNHPRTRFHLLFHD